MAAFPRQSPSICLKSYGAEEESKLAELDSNSTLLCDNPLQVMYSRESDI